nr:MAG TPA: hypothetical protein [Caudoviricetes sp.]DAZ09170.1 MAG TPA: hypothetical protein [Caudoviricetes sp.]
MRRSFAFTYLTSFALDGCILKVKPLGFSTV